MGWVEIWGVLGRFKCYWNGNCRWYGSYIFVNECLVQALQMSFLYTQTIKNQKTIKKFKKNT